MYEKLEKLIVAATDLAVQMTVYYAKQNGFTPGQSVSREAGEAAPVPKPRKPRATANANEAAAKPETAAASPFGELGSPAGEIAKLSPEEALEARRRGQEVMGLFIRRYLKANPTGLDRAKKIINEVLGGPRAPKAAWQLEDILPEDWLKLTPIFEAELDKADPK